MAFTRIKYDEPRVRRELHQSTGSGRHVLDVPGPGSDAPYYQDSFIRLQKWGANLRTNTTDLESDLHGLTRSLNRDMTNLNEYVDHKASSTKVGYNVVNPQTEQSRATDPAWTILEKPQHRPTILLENKPQDHWKIPFHINTTTRNLIKDNYTRTNA